MTFFYKKDAFKEAESKLKPLKGSKIAFFKNGKCHGVAFSDIYAGTYYPAVSLYKSASATVNFGPSFKYPISEPGFGPYKPVSDLAEERFIEQTLSDLVYHVCHEGAYE